MSPSSAEVSRGIVYFSSVPRNMRPSEVRNHFNKFGTILRMRFIPYPKKERRPGGPLLPLQYKEGWMEFSAAKDARLAAATMNSSPVECKRTRHCYGQLWTVKYLDDFVFENLAEAREEERRDRRLKETAAKREERGVNEAFRRAFLESSKLKSKSTTRKRKRDSDDV